MILAVPIENRVELLDMVKSTWKSATRSHFNETYLSDIVLDIGDKEYYILDFRNVYSSNFKDKLNFLVNRSGYTLGICRVNDKGEVIEVPKPSDYRVLHSLGESKLKRGIKFRLANPTFEDFYGTIINPEKLPSKGLRFLDPSSMTLCVLSVPVLKYFRIEKI